MRFLLKLAQSAQPGEKKFKNCNENTNILLLGSFFGGENAPKGHFKPKQPVE
jgi:hypothetical protein